MLKYYLIIVDKNTFRALLFCVLILENIIDDKIEKLSADKIIILSTHNVGDVEELCNHIGILNDGELTFSGSISEVKELTHTNTLEKAYLTMINGGEV